MKKIFLPLLIATSICYSATAQDDKFMKAMEPKVVAVDTARKTEDLLALSAAFERIGDAEKTKWLPYYYAALTQVNAAYFMGMENMKADKTDPIADKAEALINKADALNPNNSEIYVVKKMVASLRMMGDPMNRFMQYGPIAEQALQTAIKLNPENPRIYLLQGQDKFYTPEQYGGSKTEAKKLFDEANKKYAAFKPASSIEPNWGRPTVQFFLSQLNN
ncbi:MAG: hypothetical protein EOO10_04280 [Chitinophagaceae bacterium]|nr:MAG: hypothetical protein EOO10_04280 [Chitinophagaceae bacterium]